MRKHRNSITKAKGTVKWFDDAKGYGFISYKDVDYFVHFSNIRMKGHKTLVKDQSVLFIPMPSPDGKPTATEVEINDKESSK